MPSAAFPPISPIATPPTLLPRILDGDRTQVEEILGGLHLEVSIGHRRSEGKRRPHHREEQREEHRDKDVGHTDSEDAAASSPTAGSPAASNRWIEHSEAALLELVLESGAKHLGGVVLPVLAEED